jgi:hypothetical protein
MMTNSPELLQIGAVAIIFLFAVKEFFRYLNNKGGHPNYDKDIALVKQQLTNHMNHACEDIKELKIAVKDINLQLSEINRKLDKLN